MQAGTRRLLFVVVLAGCASAPDVRLPDDQLYFVRTQRSAFMWSGWDFYVRSKKSWYVDGNYTGIALNQSLTIQGDWYNPESSERRDRLSVLASTGLIFPPNYLFLAGLRPDRRCTATLEFSFQGAGKYAVTKAVAPDEEVQLELHDADTGELLSRAACEKR